MNQNHQNKEPTIFARLPFVSHFSLKRRLFGNRFLQPLSILRKKKKDRAPGFDAEPSESALGLVFCLEKKWPLTMTKPSNLDSR